MVKTIRILVKFFRLSIIESFRVMPLRDPSSLVAAGLLITQIGSPTQVLLKDLQESPPIRANHPPLPVMR